MPDDITYIIVIIKYFITILGGYVIISDTSKKDLFFFLLFGAFTVFLQIFVFYNPLKDYGRYSGFYLNPNSLGFICMMGYGLTFGIEKKWRTWGQIAFTFIGFLTFSRTFLVVWLLMNLLSIRLSFRNIKILAIGLGLFIGLLLFNSFLPKSNPRLEAMSNILEGQSSNTAKLEEGGRTETWANFYPALMEKPIFGNGYGSFGGGGVAGRIGAHNTYLIIMGEAGIISVVVFLIILVMMIIKSNRIFQNEPHLLLMSIALCLFLMANHNFFDSGYVLFFTMWLQYHAFHYNEIPIRSKKSELNTSKN